MRYGGVEDPRDLEWKLDGRCAEVGGNLFFPERGESAKPAKRVCMACDQRTTCLEYAIEKREPFGVWGGKTERERRRIIRDRNREAAAEREDGAA